MGYYDASDLPFYYALANAYAIADAYHASVLGPTWPNRMYLYAGTSAGMTRNAWLKPAHTIFEYLDRRKVSYKVYFSDLGNMGAWLLKLVPDEHVAMIGELATDAEAGHLPSVAFVNATFDADLRHATWEHPPDLPELGEQFVASVVHTLATSSGWERSALFLTFDEHGGLFDHVTPPPACPPDSIAPELGPGDPPGGFDQYGVRVPLLVVSPWARRHFVSHRVYDHTSILRFIEARFVIGALSARDANARVPWEMFDFDHAPDVSPPKLPSPTVAASVVDDCARLFP